MQCPICGSTRLKVLETRPQVNGVSRRRRCANGHRFSTLEEISVIDWQVVKRSGRQAAFKRREALEHGIRIAGKNQLSDEEISRMAARVIARLAALNKPAPVFETEEIGNFVLDELRKESPSSACRFAIVFLSPRGALGSARAFLRWLDRTFPKTGGVASGGEPWSPDDPPRHVVKKMPGGREDFDRAKLRESVTAAAKGRGRAGYRGQVTDAELDQIIDRVLHQVRGQACVTSGQLSAAVMSVLMEWDELAYLRYASVAMDFDEVSDFKVQSETIAARKPDPA